ncbi:MAG: S9 family peptidase [Kistimonas sp.]|nr:S9 family peptidase [Kistimonas sp.]
MTPKSFANAGPGPCVPARPQVRCYAGRERRDEYSWLEDPESQEVKDWLEKENAWTQAVMADSAPLEDQLYLEMKARLRETFESLPYQWRGYEFFERTLEGREYPIHYRRKLGQAAPELLFDSNQQAGKHAYFELGSLAVSPDNRFLVWAEDSTGDEEWTLSIRNLDTGELLPESLDTCSSCVVWAADSQSFWYLRLDACRRPWQLCHHRLGTAVTVDRVLLEETDARFFMALSADRTEQLLLVELASTDTTEYLWGPLSEPDAPLQLMRPREKGLEYYPDFDGHQFYIKTNDQGINYRLVTASVQQPQHWTELVPHRQDVTLEDYELFPGHLVLFEREKGLVQVRIRQLHTGDSCQVAFPDALWSVAAGDNAEYDAGFLRLEYESLNRPLSVLDVCLDTGHWQLRWQLPVEAGFNPDDYQTRRIQVPSEDGVLVPVSLVGRRESFSRPVPVLLYGYGAYGASEDPGFSSGRLNLLDRGMLFAIAHVRGGGDLGEHWYRQGKGLHKKNSFADFVACARFLIDQNITAADRLLAEGGSAGGLLVAASLNRAPELFAGAVLNVPFVDVLNTMLDPGLPLTVTEYDEWGDPADPAVYDYIHSYSPVDGVKAGPYPPQLVTTALADSRVPFWEAVKWVARVRSQTTGCHPALLKIHMQAGHGGASGRYQAMRELACEQAFMLTLVKSFLDSPAGEKSFSSS